MEKGTFTFHYGQINISSVNEVEDKADEIYIPLWLD